MAGGFANRITGIRQRFARKKLKAENYRLFQKDLQAEQAQRLAKILNNITKEMKRKIVLFIDRFEKLATTANVKSDKTYYEYWYKNFIHPLSRDVLLLQNGRLDFDADYQLYLTRHSVRSFELQTSSIVPEIGD